VVELKGERRVENIKRKGKKKKSTVSQIGQRCEPAKPPTPARGGSSTAHTHTPKFTLLLHAQPTQSVINAVTSTAVLVLY
jgi:hypothetical protein